MYVGKILTRMDDPLVRRLLEICGPVRSWKRVLDPNTGVPKRFGFCEFDAPEGVLRAMRSLDGYPLGDGETLLLNVNQATKASVEAYETTRDANPERDAADDADVRARVRIRARRRSFRRAVAATTTKNEPNGVAPRRTPSYPPSNPPRHPPRWRNGVIRRRIVATRIATGTEIAIEIANGIGIAPETAIGIPPATGIAPGIAPACSPDARGTAGRIAMESRWARAPLPRSSPRATPRPATRIGIGAGPEADAGPPPRLGSWTASASGNARGGSRPRASTPRRGEREAERARARDLEDDLAEDDEWTRAKAEAGPARPSRTRTRECSRGPPRGSPTNATPRAERHARGTRGGRQR